MRTFIEVLQVVSWVVGVLVLGSAAVAFLSPAIRDSYLRGVQLEADEESSRQNFREHHA